MPRAQQLAGKPIHELIESNAEQRGHQAAGEQVRRLNPHCRIRNRIAKAALPSADAGDVFPDDRADHAERAGNFEAAHDVRKRRGNAQLPHRLPFRGVVEAEQVFQMLIRRVKPDQRVGQHRAEADQKSDNDDRPQPRIEPDDDDRSDGDDRNRLQHDRVRIDASLDHFRTGEQNRAQHASDDGEQKADHGFQRRRVYGAEQAPPVVPD